MNEIWISAIGLCCTSIIGSIIGFLFKKLPHKWNDTILGYCAGLMLAASTLGLIVPAFEHSSSNTYVIVIISVIVGALFLNLLDYITPHMHYITGLDKEEHKNNRSLNNVLLFVMAIAIHKLPEGIAAGVSINNAIDYESSLLVSLSIALQNIPEGIVIIAPLILAGVSNLRTLLIAISIGILEIIGVFIGYGLGNISEYLLPFMLAIAGGAMLYVTSDEMIPETHSHGYQKQATYALLLGFMTFIIMEKLY